MIDSRQEGKSVGRLPISSSIGDGIVFWGGC